jgi:cytochrome c-type biogenesis protein
MGANFAEIARGGPIVLAVAVAALAGLVSFLSPCILPLVPGYLSYVTGLAGADLDDALQRGEAGRGRRARGRMLAGTAGFVAGFTAVFTLTSVVAASVGRALLAHARVLEVVIGALIVALGLAFLGLIPGLQRELRLQRLPAAGLASAPVLGAVFAVSWVPCLGPTLVAVLGLAAVGGATGRAVTLAIAYCLGLGLPFLAFALGLRRVLGVFAAVRRHSDWVTRIGGGLLILVGLALVTGAWGEFLNWLRASVGPGSVGI